MRRAAIACLLLAWSVVIAPMAFAQATATDPAMEARLKRLEEELRCLVCQNQSLADSNASLAEDLRREVRGLAASGKSDDEIKDYLVARYGDFVLYRPPVKRTTWLLWFGPFVLLVAGALLWWMIARRRSRRDDGVVLAAASSPESNAAAQAKARDLLDGIDD